MEPSAGTMTTNETNPTWHAMVIVRGQFARTIGLLTQLAQVPIAQKAVIRAPYEKLVALLLGLLAGIEHLTDLSAGAAPLVQDAEVAAAWKLHRLADASGISRTLAACTEQTVAVLEHVLDAVRQPFLDRAVGKLQQRPPAFCAGRGFDWTPGASIAALAANGYASAISAASTAS